MRNILAMLLSLMLASGAAFAGDQSADASQDKKAASEQPAADAGSESTEDENAGDSE